MKKYAVSDLVKEVKVLLDRNQESSGLLTPDDTDTLSQAELIKSKIVDAASIILSDAPVDMVDGIKLDNISVSWASKNNAYVGTVYMPADMIRLLSVRASDWNRNAEIITENDEAYKYQGCKYGVRGNPDRPIAAVIHTNGGRYLELYTSKSNSVTVDFTYVAQHGKQWCRLYQSTEQPERCYPLYGWLSHLREYGRYRYCGWVIGCSQKTGTYC